MEQGQNFEFLDMEDEFGIQSQQSVLVNATLNVVMMVLSDFSKYPNFQLSDSE